MMQESINKWYTSAYPSDELGHRIPTGITFQDIYDKLLTGSFDYKDVANDSIIRERVFGNLAFILGVSYNYIYHLWRKADR